MTEDPDGPVVDHSKMMHVWWVNFHQQQIVRKLEKRHIYVVYKSLLCWQIQELGQLSEQLICRRL